MGEEFRRNLSDTQLKTSVLIDDISNTHNALRGKQFDAIVMSNILTSMPRLPDFALILPLLTPDGALIIADIDPSYTVQHPYYSVKLNGESYALKPNPVNPIELCQLLCSMNMQITVAKPVRRKGGTNYSFCLVFKPES